jgi:hypothetical protein
MHTVLSSTSKSLPLSTATPSTDSPRFAPSLIRSTWYRFSWVQSRHPWSMALRTEPPLHLMTVQTWFASNWELRCAVQVNVFCFPCATRSQWEKFSIKSCCDCQYIILTSLLITSLTQSIKLDQPVWNWNSAFSCTNASCLCAQTPCFEMQK